MVYTGFCVCLLAFSLSAVCVHGFPYNQFIKLSSTSKDFTRQDVTGTIDKLSEKTESTKSANGDFILYEKLLKESRGVNGQHQRKDVTLEHQKLRTFNTVVFVIDPATSVNEDLFMVKQRMQAVLGEIHGTGTDHGPNNYIIVTFSDTDNKTDIFQSGNLTNVNEYINNLTIQAHQNTVGLSLAMLKKVVIMTKPKSKIHIFTNTTPKDPDRLPELVNMVKKKEIIVDVHVIGTAMSRSRRSAGLDLYGGLAAASGGSVYHTDKGGVGKIADIIKESATTSAATILKMSVPRPSTNKQIDIPVDNTIREISIKIIANTSAAGEPSNTLTDPDKKTIAMATSGNVSIKNLGGGLRLIKIKSPKPGIWQLTKTDSYSWNVEVTGQSTIDFTTKFVQTNPLNGFQYEITGRPIAGEKATVIITVPSIDKIGGISQVVLTDSTGTRLGNATLTQGRGRAESIFKGSFTLPKKAFQVTTEGTDNAGNTLQRLQPTIISPIAVKLAIGTLSGSLYINENLKIPYTVTNTGDTKTTIKVDITDDQGFAVKPTSNSVSLEGGANSTGSFTLHAGSKEGVTTTVTVSAQPVGVTSHSPQFDTRRITVEKHVIRKVDNTTPECNVTSMKGSCTEKQMDPCNCHKYTWSGTAVFGDVDSGLFQVSSTSDKKDDLSYDNFTMGHTLDKGIKTATIRSDCCQPVTYINVVDLESNTGQCKFDLAPGLNKPAHLCRHETTSTSTRTTTTAVNTLTTEVTMSASEGGLSTGAIAGIAVGLLAAVAATITVAVVISKTSLCAASSVEASLPPTSTKIS